jgi:hypothetical protein
MSAPMVRALLDGKKTQTRRALRMQPPDDRGLICGVYNPTVIRRGEEEPGPETFGAFTEDGSWATKCPYGQPGDRLWVRETFAFTDAHEPDYEGSIEYRADHKCFAVSCNELIDVPHTCDPRPFDGQWASSIHMPRWASRITLEITDVRAQRLQDISEADAIAEGLIKVRGPLKSTMWEYSETTGGQFADPRVAYHMLWESINGPGSWDANHWVWAISFRMVAT